MGLHNVEAVRDEEGSDMTRLGWSATPQRAAQIRRGSAARYKTGPCFNGTKAKDERRPFTITVFGF